jgi:hypothetical protein
MDPWGLHPRAVQNYPGNGGLEVFPSTGSAFNFFMDLDPAETLKADPNPCS